MWTDYRETRHDSRESVERSVRDDVERNVWCALCRGFVQSEMEEVKHRTQERTQNRDYIKNTRALNIVSGELIMWSLPLTRINLVC